MPTTLYPSDKLRISDASEMIDEDKSIEFDGAAIKENYVSITPIHYRLTHEPFLNDLKNQYSDE